MDEAAVRRPGDPAADVLLRAEGLGKRFVTGEGAVIEVLRGLDLEVARGERLAILGQSGIGKSTLLHVLGTLDHPSEGHVWFEGRDVFARTGEAEGSRGLSAFIVPAEAVGVEERIEVIAPHPLARLKYDNVRIPADAIVGEPGEGFRVGMETLNLFRVTVAAAALGFA